MTKPLSLSVAQKIKNFKQNNNLSYADLGKLIGLSGTMLSARVVHCEGNPDNKPTLALSNQSLALINAFFAKKEDTLSFDKIETSVLIQELKKRGATSIVF